MSDRSEGRAAGCLIVLLVLAVIGAIAWALPIVGLFAEVAGGLG